MKRIIASTLLTISALAIVTHSHALENNALYQWTTKDGTPTYSPERPPEGIDYVVVDADLKPLAVQPAKEPVATATKPAPAAPVAIPADALYQWKTKDGTPTYSPDPPPDGVDYTVVDADLNPLPVQPTADAKASNRVRVDLSQGIKNAPQPKWKPVIYAQDPSLKNIKRKKSANTGTVSPPAVGDLTVAATAPAVESDACLLLKREKLVLESAFSKAKTDAQMDKAILELKEAAERYKKECR